MKLHCFQKKNKQYKTTVDGRNVCLHDELATTIHSFSRKSLGLSAKWRISWLRGNIIVFVWHK